MFNYKIKKLGVMCACLAVFSTGCGNKTEGDYYEGSVDETSVEKTLFEIPDTLPSSDKVKFKDIKLNITEAYYISGTSEVYDINYKDIGYHFMTDEEMANCTYLDADKTNGSAQRISNEGEYECSFMWGDGVGCTYTDVSVNYYDSSVVRYEDFDDYNLDKYMEEKDFELIDKDEAIKEIETAIGIDFDENWMIDIYYLDHEILAQEEKHVYMNENGEFIDDKSLYKDEWTKEDDAYLFFIRQSYCSLPCFYEINGPEGSFEANNSPIMVFYNKNGIIRLKVMNLMNTSIDGRQQELLTFDEVLRIVFEEYDLLLDDCTYEIYGADLFCKYSEINIFPAWHFRVICHDTTNNTDLEHNVYIDATTGEFN